jgi:hypothetical protein
MRPGRGDGEAERLELADLAAGLAVFADAAGVITGAELMEVLLDALGYQARQPHQEDVSTSSTDAHKELLADVMAPGS